MRLLLTFMVTVFSSVAAVCMLCVLVERWTSSFTSLLLFFPLFFLTIVGSWLLSVRMTEPRPGHAPELHARKA